MKRRRRRTATTKLVGAAWRNATCLVYLLLGHLTELWNKRFFGEKMKSMKIPSPNGHESRVPESRYTMNVNGYTHAKSKSRYIPPLSNFRSPFTHHTILSMV